MSSFVKGMRCTLCHHLHETSAVRFTCPTCGEKGILDIEYDYEAMKTIITKSYFSQCKDHSMWRYAPMMSVNPAHADAMLKVGPTPLYLAKELHKSLGLKQLYIKDEGAHPTGSLKDRASAVAVMKALEEGQKVIACSSTGNAASSLAGHAARMGLKTVIFVPKRAPIGKVTQLLIYGAEVLKVDGDYKQAFNLSKAAIDHYGWYNRNAAINPHLVEGKKTVALEIAEQLHFDLTDWVAVSVGDGCTIAGVYKGFYDLYQLGLIKRIPKLLGVQSEGCAPFVKAYEQGQDLEETDENTIADSIAVGIPRNPIKALRAVERSHGAWIAVSDEDILAGMRELGAAEGIFGEPAGVTALPGIVKALKQGIISPKETVTMIMTGNGLKDPENAQKAIKVPALLKPDLAALHKHLKEKGEI